MLSISQIRPSGPRRMPILHGWRSCVLAGATAPEWELQHVVDRRPSDAERLGDGRDAEQEAQRDWFALAEPICLCRVSDVQSPCKAEPDQYAVDFE
jgi:hypothetical protein